MGLDDVDAYAVSRGELYGHIGGARWALAPRFLRFILTFAACRTLIAGHARHAAGGLAAAGVLGGTWSARAQIIFLWRILTCRYFLALYHNRIAGNATNAAGLAAGAALGLPAGVDANWVARSEYSVGHCVAIPSAYHHLSIFPRYTPHSHRRPGQPCCWACGRRCIGFAGGCGRPRGCL